MARRYIGDAVVNITYRDRGDYAGTISAGGYTWHFDDLRAPQIGFGPGIAYDSPEAYDEMAGSAVAFGSYYTTHNRGDDLPEWAPEPEVADAIDEAVSWAQDDQGNYDVRRKPHKRNPMTEQQRQALLKGIAKKRTAYKAVEQSRAQREAEWQQLGPSRKTYLDKQGPEYASKTRKYWAERYAQEQKDEPRTLRERWLEGNVVIDHWLSGDRKFLGIFDENMEVYIEEWWDNAVDDLIEDRIVPPVEEWGRGKDLERDLIRYATKVEVPAYPTWKSNPASVVHRRMVEG